MSQQKQQQAPLGSMNVIAWMFIAFLVLKLIEVDGRGVSPVHDWSWWWVTSPIWGVLVAALGVAGLKVWAQKRKAKRLLEQRLNVEEQVHQAKIRQYWEGQP